MISADQLFLFESMLYDKATLLDMFKVDEADMIYNERFMDDMLGDKYDTFPLVKIEDGYAHDIPTSHGRPDFFIYEESFDQALKDKWIEITG